ncbi:MAG: ABC transporter permease, partial [Candidatus Didemnitutus sp.]|nr:ABC transporter permease [Candidatus Didemnitutus sp.]
RDLEAEMAEEMRFHLDQRATDFAGDGLAAADARLAAQRKFGNTAALQERARDTFGWGALERMAQDLRFAARQLVRAPGFSVLAIITLGLGIGANSSMFSVLNGVLLKPLPYSELDRLEQIYRVSPQNPEGAHSAADYLAFRAAPGAYERVSAWIPNRVTLSDPGQPAQLAFGALASSDLFSLLGVTPQLGRAFHPDENTPGRHRVVLLSERVWKSRYGATPDIVGRTIRVDGEPHSVIGVLPASFNDWRHLGNIDFFRPFALTPEFSADHQKANVRIMARRAPGVTAVATAAAAAGFGAERARAFPEFNAESSWRAVPLQSVAGGASGGMVLPMLVGLSAFVLLIACSNLANFLLARTMARAREFAIRGALGASRLQLLRPLAAEATLLSLAGGGLALVVAHGFREWAALRSTGDNGERVWFELDARVMVWTFAASFVTAIAFGLAPALFAMRLDLNDTLKSGGRGTHGTRGHQRLRQFLIVGQFALAMVLLAGAAVFIRGLDDLHHRRSGWASTHVVTGSAVLPASYATPEQLAAFHRLALERLTALPGVESATLAGAAPFFHWTDVRKFAVEGHAPPSPGREPAAMVNTISPDYLTTFGMQLVAGRAFTARDDATAPRVYLVSQSTARAFFGSENPLGRRLAPVAGGEPRWGEIVGVVADFLTVDPDPNPVVHRVYQPLGQEPPRSFELAVRASADVAPSALVEAIRTTFTSLDPDLPVRRLQSADQNIARTLYQLGVLRDMLAAFGVLGLALASLGVYGIIARTMAQRAGEFAIRLALGAGARDISRLVLGSGVRLAVAGSVLGLVGAIGVTSILASAYPGIRTQNGLILAGTTLVLVTVALLACWLPARRAGKIDAMDALRAE